MKSPSELFELLKFPASGNRAVMVQGANGGWVDTAGSSRGLSNALDLEWLIANRAVSDAVLVSAKTAIAEKYSALRHRPEYAELRLKNGLAPKSLLVCITSEKDRLETVLQFCDLVLSNLPHPDSRVIHISETGPDFLRVAVKELRLRGLHRLIWEGGPALLDQAIEAGLLQQFALTKSSQPAIISKTYPNIQRFFENNSVNFREGASEVEFQLIGVLPTWKDLLPAHNYAILRKAHTEPAFSVAYEKSPAAGFYSCGACGNRLFEATTQFDARCGWPAFWEPSAAAKVKLVEDHSYGMRRVEVVCAACDSHLGHVFYGEGFGFPTDARYCINAGALKRH